MDDNMIVKLYWSRSQDAIKQTDIKYGNYCKTISYNIVGNLEDATECVNDTYLDAWNSMPPHKPSILSTFLGKITRRISIDRWRKSTADKRGGGQTEVVLDELTECIPSDNSVENEIEMSELERIIDSFVSELPLTERRVFVCRYWYADPICDIALRFSFSESRVKSMLYRTRQKLKNLLEQEGY